MIHCRIPTAYKVALTDAHVAWFKAATVAEYRHAIRLFQHAITVAPNRVCVRRCERLIRQREQFLDRVGKDCADA